MAYATPAELRARYRKGLDSDQDEFALREDADLAQALEAASSEIDSYRPQGGPVSVVAASILRDKAMALARMLLYQDQNIEEGHPIVREALAVRAWLMLLGRGTIRLPADAETPSAPAAPTRTMVYSDDWSALYEPAAL